MSKHSVSGTRLSHEEVIIQPLDEGKVDSLKFRDIELKTNELIEKYCKDICENIEAYTDFDEWMAKGQARIYTGTVYIDCRDFDFVVPIEVTVVCKGSDIGKDDQPGVIEEIYFVYDTEDKE